MTDMIKSVINQTFKGGKTDTLIGKPQGDGAVSKKKDAAGEAPAATAAAAATPDAVSPAAASVAQQIFGKAGQSGGEVAAAVPSSPKSKKPRTILGTLGGSAEKLGGV